MRVKQLFLAASLLCAYVPAIFADTFIFAAPPRETLEQGQKVYGPIASYLSEATGEHFKYRHYKYWPIYVRDMQAGKLDLVFDGPHFISWRIAELSHNPLVRLPGKLDFAVVSRAEDAGISELGDLAGHMVCGHVPPNLATLTLEKEFSNPFRKPQIREIRGFTNAFKGLFNGDCRGTVIPVTMYKKLLDNKVPFATRTRLLFQSKPSPNQGFSAGPRLSAELQTHVRNALLASGGIEATAALRDRFAGGTKKLIGTSRSEYNGFDHLLSNYWGFKSTKPGIADSDSSVDGTKLVAVEKRK